jgi:hypothetical protein
MLAREPRTAQPVVMPLVTQRIGCQPDVTREVFLVWRFKGVDLVREDQGPAGTVVKDGLLRRPMPRRLACLGPVPLCTW